VSRALLITKKWLVGVGVLFVVMTAIGYVVGVNSAAMAFADQTIRRSESVHQRIGEVRTVRLKLWGFSLSSEYSGDRAELNLAVEGSTGAIDVTMNLKELDGRWTIVEASIPL
jgi:hypothetical protein